MAKKFVLVLIFAAIVAGGVFADWPATATWGGTKNHISGTAGLLEGGAAYERFLTDKWSIGADIYFAWSFFFWTHIEVGGFGRYYIWNGLFAEMGLGFHRYSAGVLFGTSTITGVAISPGIGFKFDPGKPGGFFVEPGIKFPITLGARKQSVWVGNWLVGYYEEKSVFAAGFGIIAYVGLGYAF